MPTQIIDGFSLGSAVPIDNRIVASGSVARDAIAYKYEGLRVFDTSDSVPYVWIGGTWSSEKSNITGTVDYIPKFTGTSSIGDSSIYYVGTDINIEPTNLTINTGNVLINSVSGDITTRTGGLYYTFCGDVNIKSYTTLTLSTDDSAISHPSHPGMTLSITNNDFYASIHNRGTNGIGDSGNTSTPWTTPTIASGTMSMTSLHFIDGTNCSFANGYTTIWTRIGNIVNVSGRIDISTSTASTALSFKIETPIFSGLNNNYQLLNGVGKEINNSGNVASIVADWTGSKSYAHFSMISSVMSPTILYQYQYVLGTYSAWPW